MSSKPARSSAPGGATLFLMPWFVGVVGLTVIPAAASLVISMLRWDGLSLSSNVQWVGWDNYRRIATDDPTFRKALVNSLVYALAAAPLSVAASLGAAVLLSRPVRGIAVFRTLFYLPHVLGGVATILIWSWLLNPSFGPVNALLRSAYALMDPVVRLWSADGNSAWGVPGWFHSPGWCKPGLILMQVWTFGGSMLIFLAAIQHVPHNLRECAFLDGAGRWRAFVHVSLPYLTPALLFNLVTGLAASMQAFSQAYLLFNRAQDNGLLLYVLYLYRCAFEPPYRVGYASALAWVLFALVFVLVIAAVRSSRSWVFYEARA